MSEKNHLDWLPEEVLFEDASRLQLSRPAPSRGMVVAVVLAMMAIGIGILASLSGVFS